jgi:ABC-2 type transport system permease protein
MDKFWVVAKREYLERVRSRWFVIMTLFVPILITATFLIPAWVAARSAAGAGSHNVLIIDATGAGLGQRVAKVLMNDSSTTRTSTTKSPLPRTTIESEAMPRVVEVTPAQLASVEDSATKQVMKPKSITGYLVLDDSTLSTRRVRYAGRNASSIVDMDKLRSAVKQALTGVLLQREGVKPETIALVSNLSLNMPATRIDERGKGGSGQAAVFLGIGIGILLLMSIVFHGQNVLRGVLEEKTTRVAEVVISSIKPEMLLAGKVAGAGAVGLTQQVLWIAITAYLMTNFAPILLRNAGGGLAPDSTALGPVFGSLTIGLFIVFVLYFLLGFIFYASLLAAAGAMVNTEQDAQQAAMPVLYLLIGSWLFVNSVIFNPGGTTAKVLSWLPFSSPIIMPMRVGLSPVPWTSIAGSLAVCALGCVLAVWLAARIYRVGMLMYGKKPSLAEVAKWVRYA